MRVQITDNGKLHKWLHEAKHRKKKNRNSKKKPTNQQPKKQKRK